MNVPTPADPPKPASDMPWMAPGITSAGQMYHRLLDPTSCEVSDTTIEMVRFLESRVPVIRDVAHASRIFVRRATRFLVGRGIRQIIDLGSGLPTIENTHEVAHVIVPDTRVVYVDIDDMTAAHANSLLSDTHNVAFVQGDVADIETVLSKVEATGLIDFDEPVGVMMCSILHLIPEEYCREKSGMSTHQLVSAYMDAVVGGSYLVLEQFTADGQGEAECNAIREVVPEWSPRPVHEIRRYFDGLALQEPQSGQPPELVYSNVWGAADPSTAYERAGSWLRAGVGSKP